MTGSLYSEAMGIFGLISAALLTFSGSPHRVVIEVNSPNHLVYGTVLNNAANLRKALAPEPVEIEIVCHGEGLAMLTAKENALTKRLAETQKTGTHLVICANTLKGKKMTAARLVPGVTVVPSGIAEVVKKQEAVWSYLKGGF